MLSTFLIVICMGVSYFHYGYDYMIMSSLLDESCQHRGDESVYNEGATIVQNVDFVRRITFPFFCHNPKF